MGRGEGEGGGGGGGRDCKVKFNPFLSVISEKVSFRRRERERETHLTVIILLTTIKRLILCV